MTQYSTFHNGRPLKLFFFCKTVYYDYSCMRSFFTLSLLQMLIKDELAPFWRTASTALPSPSLEIGMKLARKKGSSQREREEKRPFHAVQRHTLPNLWFANISHFSSNYKVGLLEIHLNPKKDAFSPRLIH